MKYFTVGPTQPHINFELYLKEAIKKEIHSLSHRSLEFANLYKTLAKNIKKLFNASQNSQIVFLGSATEFMERSIQNLSTHTTLHFVSGAFGNRCYELAKSAGRNAVEVRNRIGGTFSLEDIPENQKNIDPEVIFFVHNETSSGLKVPKKFMEFVMEKFPNAIYVCDVVSSAPVCDIPIKKLDLTYFSVQKGFGLPAGLGVGILSQKLIDRAKELENKVGENIKSRNIFHSFVQMSEDGKNGKTKETPNVLLIFLLNKVIENYLKMGVKKIKQDTAQKAKTILDALNKINFLKINNIDKNWQSETTIVAHTPNGSKSIVEKLKKLGFLIASGYGREKEQKIRIANFPQHKVADVKKLVKIISHL